MPCLSETISGWEGGIALAKYGVQRATKSIIYFNNMQVVLPVQLYIYICPENAL